MHSAGVFMNANGCNAFGVQPNKVQIGFTQKSTHFQKYSQTNKITEIHATYKNDLTASPFITMPSATIGKFARNPLYRHTLDCNNICQSEMESMNFIYILCRWGGLAKLN